MTEMFRAIVFGAMVVASTPALSQAPALTFGLIGDLGYAPAEEPLLQNVLDDLNSNALAFVVHVGDLSSAAYGCTDDVIGRRFAQFDASAHPFIYVPGDNEWTDCHEKQGVKGSNPLERLAHLRKVFFAGEQSLGRRTMRLIRQSQSPEAALHKYRENVRWTAAGVTFMTLHVTGSNNGLGRAPDGDAEYEERNKANLAWLQQGFEYAKANDSRAIMILQQANIFPAHAPTAGSPEKDPNGFTDVRTVLEKETIAFGKPVLLVHGDSHFFRIDKPLPARRAGTPILPSIENFTRLETFGTPNHHWVEVSVDPMIRTCSASGQGSSQPTSSNVSDGVESVAGSAEN
jgi:hypothetical protein